MQVNTLINRRNCKEDILSIFDCILTEMRAENTEDTSSTVYQSNSHMLALVEKISQEVLRKQTALDRSAVALHQESDLASTNELSPDEDNEGNGAVDTVRTTSKTSESSREDSDLNKAISISTTNGKSMRCHLQRCNL